MSKLAEIRGDGVSADMYGYEDASTRVHVTFHASARPESIITVRWHELVEDTGDPGRRWLAVETEHDGGSIVNHMSYAQAAELRDQLSAAIEANQERDDE